MKKPVRFTIDDANRQQWGFNCGPGALCAILHMTPEEIRPHMLDFESKLYTNPTLMLDILRGLNIKHKTTYRSDDPLGLPIVKYGLMRVQFGGPWTKPGVPMRVRYRHTHWVGVRDNTAELFDINAMCVGGWIPETEWTLQLIPWLIRAVEPKSDGTFWPTHVIEVDV